MDKAKEDRIIERAARMNGRLGAMIKLTEEMAELTQAIAKLINDARIEWDDGEAVYDRDMIADYSRMMEHVAEEAADVSIVLDQVARPIRGDWTAWRDYKLLRLEEMMDDETE